jgi:GT2 family glycosyltransferase
MDLPLVTVFTLIYNTNPKFVIEAIESVRANNYPNLQHIIVDDCSTDKEPKETVKKWINDNSYPCEFYEHEVNYGVCKTLNHVLELAKGEYIFGCSDDKIIPNRIIEDVNTFHKLDDRYAIVFGLSQVMDSNSLLEPKVFPYLNIPENDLYWSKLIYDNCLSAPSTTYKVKILRKIGGFCEDYSFEDYEINLRLSDSGYKFKCIPKINAYYRIHNNSISNKINFRIENIRILASFSHKDEIKSILYNTVWEMTYNKDPNYKQAIMIFEKKYSKNYKLRLTSFFKNTFLIRIMNFILKLNKL